MGGKVEIVWVGHPPTPHLKLKDFSFFSTRVSQKARKYSYIWQEKVYKKLMWETKRIIPNGPKNMQKKWKNKQKNYFLPDTHPTKTIFF